MASKPDDPSSTKAAADEVVAESTNNAQVESEDEDEPEETPQNAATETSNPAKKKKKSKKKRIKAALGMGGDGAADSPDKQKEKLSKAVAGMSQDQIQQLLSMNPSLAQEISANSGGGDLTADVVAEHMKRMKVRSLDSQRSCLEILN